MKIFRYIVGLLFAKFPAIQKMCDEVSDDIYLKKFADEPVPETLDLNIVHDEGPDPDATFVDNSLYLLKQNREAEIYTLFLDEIDQWHENKTYLDIYEWLGLTETEYAAIVQNESCLIPILKSKQNS